MFDSTTMEELGRVEVLWMYPQINRVLGFVCKSGFLGGKKTAFKLPQLESAGNNGILVKGDGEPTVAAKVKQLESLIHSEVWSDSGEKVGHIIDCLFNYRSGVIVRYLMVPGRLGSITEGVYFLSPKSIKSFGRNRVLIYADAAEHPKPYRKGWKYKLAEVRESFKEDYVEVTEDLRSFAQQMQLFSKEALHTVEHWGDRLRNETQTFIEQAKERGQSFYTKAKASGQTIFDQIRTDGLSFDDHMQDAASRSDEDFSQAVTFPKSGDTDSLPVIEDYDQDSWDDDWNDWEDAQDANLAQDDVDALDGWGNEPDWTNQADLNKADSAAHTSPSPPLGSVDAASAKSVSDTHRIDDMWDENWVDDTDKMPPSEPNTLEHTSEDPLMVDKTISDPPSSDQSPSDPAEDDDDPWI